MFFFFSIILLFSLIQLFEVYRLTIKKFNFGKTDTLFNNEEIFPVMTGGRRRPDNDKITYVADF